MATNITATPPAPSFGELLGRYRDEMTALDAATEQHDIDWLADASFATLEALSATPVRGADDLADKLQLVVDRFAECDPPNMRFVKDALDDARRLSGIPSATMPWTSNVDHRLFEAIEAHDARAAEMRTGTSNPDWEQHVDRGYAIYRQVFDLPNTFANLRIRARAIASMVNDDDDVENLKLPELAANGENLCGELVRQMLVCIMAPRCEVTPTAARVPNAAGQFVLPPIPAGVTPALAAAIDDYRTQFVTDGSADAWDDAARVVHAIKPASIADLAAKLIVALHYRDPEIADGQLATEAPSTPADRFGVEMELACLDTLLTNAARDAAAASAWAAALDRFRQADQAWDAYWETVEEPSNAAPGSDEQAAVHAESERFATACADAEDALFETPAPDLAVVLVKLERLWSNERNQIPGFNALVMADVKRLAGEARS